ncbi:MAG: hypothetical protein P3W94_005095 [Paracoccus sp. (in: a-proteobacteria)]|nr:hypothetical protein [Paracoccus sp. (in: a-proteobacteria)]
MIADRNVAATNLRAGSLAAIFLMATSQAAGLGLNAMPGQGPKRGGAINAMPGIYVFLSRKAMILPNKSLIGDRNQGAVTGAALILVIGAAYISVSFPDVVGVRSDAARSKATVAFIAFSLAVYLALGTAPAAFLVFVGGFHGLILSIGLTIFIYVGYARSDLLGGHRDNRMLLALGAIVGALTWYMGARSVTTIFAFLGV